MDGRQVFDVVCALIGSVEARGESEHDAAALKNMKKLIELVDGLTGLLYLSSLNASSSDGTVHDIGALAKDYLATLKGELP